jgi:hypothetical protein
MWREINMTLKKGNFIEITNDYCFYESRIGPHPKTVCLKKGDVGKITRVYKGYTEPGIQITFRTKTGKVFFDDTSNIYLAGKYRKLDPRKAAAKKKIKTVTKGDWP